MNNSQSKLPNIEQLQFEQTSKLKNKSQIKKYLKINIVILILIVCSCLYLFLLNFESSQYTNEEQINQKIILKVNQKFKSQVNQMIIRKINEKFDLQINEKINKKVNQKFDEFINQKIKTQINNKINQIKNKEQNTKRQTQNLISSMKKQINSRIDLIIQQKINKKIEEKLNKQKNALIHPSYRSQIQLQKQAIVDILAQLNKQTKTLIFGLGYDSKMWYEASEGKDKIVKYTYDGITVKKSFNMTKAQLDKFVIPQAILKNAPYDVVLIDAPPGWRDEFPGRLLPVYWTLNNLTQLGSKVYFHDTDRPLQDFIVRNYIKRTPRRIFGKVKKFII